MASFDVAGIGLNATDTLLVVDKFPPYAGKVPFLEESLSPGGQVASAMVACAQLGLRTKYIGTIGDDLRGQIQIDSLRMTGINLDHVQLRQGCANQSAYIVIDRSTGERTVLWRRPGCLRLRPEEIQPDQITDCRLLHIDGHDTQAVAKAARIAREHSIPVTLDVDTIYPGFDEVLRETDYLIASSEFPGNWTNQKDNRSALSKIRNSYGMKVAAMTLGAWGAFALTDDGFLYSPAFVVNCLDTTGAGDAFHGAFCYALLNGMPLAEGLEFSNAIAALNCTVVGARGGKACVAAAEDLIQRGERRVHPDYAADQAR